MGVVSRTLCLGVRLRIPTYVLSESPSRPPSRRHPASLAPISRRRPASLSPHSGMVAVWRHGSGCLSEVSLDSLAWLSSLCAHCCRPLRRHASLSPMLIALTVRSITLVSPLPRSSSDCYPHAPGHPSTHARTFSDVRKLARTHKDTAQRHTPKMAAAFMHPVCSLLS